MKKPHQEKKNTRPYLLTGFSTGMLLAFWLTGLIAGLCQRLDTVTILLFYFTSKNWDPTTKLKLKTSVIPSAQDITSPTTHRQQQPWRKPSSHISARCSISSDDPHTLCDVENESRQPGTWSMSEPYLCQYCQDIVYLSAT